jgi:hypothetical protein
MSLLPAVCAAGDKPDFAALQRRMHVRRPAAALAAALPVTYPVFDVMHRHRRACSTAGRPGPVSPTPPCVT